MTSVIARSAIPWTGSAKWSHPRPASVALPVTNELQDLDLTIVGTPTPGLEQESSRILHWPQAHIQPPSKGGHRVPKTTAWRTDNELFEQIKEKLTAGYEGVRQMFHAKDPYGKFIVTREGLFFILKSLVGHISRDQYDSFLKLICLHWRSSISFEEFIVCFQDNPVVAMHLVSDFSRKNEKQLYLENNLRNQDNLEWCPFTSAPHAFVVFRRKLREGEIKLFDILPAVCFVNNGRIIRPQLREALAMAGVWLTETEFDHIWQKFDSENNGSVPIGKFYKVLNLTPEGLPRPDPRVVKSAYSLRKPWAPDKSPVEQRCKTAMHVTTTEKHSKAESVEISESRSEIIDSRKVNGKHQESPHKVTTELATTTKEDTTTTTTVTTTTTTTTTSATQKTTTEKMKDEVVDDARLSSHVRRLIQAKKAPPEFDNVMDHLHYKFEETYRNLQSAFGLFDFMNDGYIAKTDFRSVLKEFGYEITAIDLEAFLRNAGVSVIKGLVNYNQFLQKFQSKGESSILSQVIVKNGNSLNHSYKHIETEENLRTEKMVGKLANFFHSDYIKLLGLLKQKDANNTGVVPAHELRNAINSVLKINMTDKQLDELIARLCEKSSNGGPHIDYGAFLDLFNIQPGHWNRHKSNLLVGPKYHLNEVAPSTPVMHLLEKSKTWIGSSATRNAASHLRVSEIRKDLTKLFSDRFHVFDKNFQDMDRRRTGYMSKWQFGALLKLCGLTLTISDLDHLWTSLDTAADNTLSYATLVKTFCSGQQQNKTSAEKPSSAKSAQKPALIERQRTAPALMTVEQPKVTAGSAKDRRLTELLQKVKDDVLKRWDVLYSIFLNIDRDGYSSVSVQDMRDIAYKMKLNLTLPERIELCNLFDLHGNGWFNYVSFLNAVKKLCPGQQLNPCVFNIHTKHLEKTAGPDSVAITVYDFLTELKRILLKKFKTLRGSFKFFDHNHNGFIEEGELRKSLQTLGYKLSSQDFLDILQVFDRSQGQKLSYEDFKATLLTV